MIPNSAQAYSFTKIYSRTGITFYQKLSIKRKRFFDYRVAAFIAKYNFAGKGGYVVTDQVRILISATFVMLTFGMRHYLINVFDRIIVYPESYFSNINQEYHKGEFNPRMNAVVFSWKDFHLKKTI